MKNLILINRERRKNFPHTMTKEDELSRFLNDEKIEKKLSLMEKLKYKLIK